MRIPSTKDIPAIKKVPTKIIPTTENIITLFKKHYKFKKSELQNIEWYLVAENKKLTEKFFDKFKDEFNYSIYPIIKNKILSINYILKNLKYFDSYQATLLQTYSFSEQDITKNFKFFGLQYEYLLLTQKLSKRFIEKHISLNINDTYHLIKNLKLRFNVSNFLLSKFPNINVESIEWSILSNKMIKLGMAYDAQHHSNPELFDNWAKGGFCPYYGNTNVRKIHFPQQKKLWDPKLKTIKLPTKEKMFEMFFNDTREQIRRRQLIKKQEIRQQQEIRKQLKKEITKNDKRNKRVINCY